MSAIKWLDEHFEEAIMVVLLALISSVMMAQVIARNVFNSMTWPEEFSRYCYIWTVFLSLGYTIKKGNMLKVGIVMDLLPQKLRRTIEIVVNIIILAICVVFFRYSITYTGIIHKTGQISPAMHIPMWMMYLATVLGFGMALIRTVQEIVSNIKNFNVKAETTLEATLKEAKEEVETTGIKIDDEFKNSGGDEVMALWIFVVFMVALIFAVPIAMSMVLGALTPLFLGGAGSSIQQLIANSFSGSDSTPILAVPLFILGGVLMAEGGISRRLFNFFAYFVGNLTGGLPCAVILTCLFYGAISGSGPATTAAVGSMTIPFLVEMGYDKTWASGMIATSGGLGVIIPPSIPFVLYSLATGVSTGALFLGGVLPGIAIGLGMMVYAVYYCKKNGEDKEKIGNKMKELREKGLFKLFKESFWALLSPVIVLGGIYSGYVTPTEAACISVFYSLFVSLIVYKSFTVKEIIPFLAKAVRTYAPLCFVLAFAIAFGRVLALAKAPAIIEAFILDNFTTSFTVLTGIVIVFLFLGMVMDTGPAIVILAPILLPAVQALGVHPVHFGVIMVCCLSIGLATPPFGLDLFVAGTLSDTPPMTVAKKAMPFIIAFGIVLFIITYVPWLSLALL